MCENEKKREIDRERGMSINKYQTCNADGEVRARKLVFVGVAITLRVCASERDSRYVAVLKIT